MKVEDRYKFLLLNLIILYVTMPGSIYIAYFDSYHMSSLMNVIIGFHNWLYSYLIFSPIVLVYLAIKREKRLLSVYAILIVGLIILYNLIHNTLFLCISPEVARPSLPILFDCYGVIVMFFLFLPAILSPLSYSQFHPIFSLINFTLLILIIFFSYKIIKIKRISKH